MNFVDVNDLENVLACPKCGGPLKKVSWKITAGFFDPGKEVEQTALQCPDDDEFISFEVSTGNLSKFAILPDDYDDGQQSNELA
ncbi:MAG: hypothetical protein H6799_03375 [Candidatus Nomurabacteria bacterium]|nr:MAG: hypothetical protein H6799_03375 [Candidatus Nomurabacteria bacterium]HRV76243.1 hypothetical protein [Candidatus Saccharimonadales bacterium]